MKKKWLIIFVFAVLFCGLLGYIYKAIAIQKPTVAVILKDSKSEYWDIMVSGIEKGFANFGVSGKIYAPGQNQLSTLKKGIKGKTGCADFLSAKSSSIYTGIKGI